MELIVKQDIGKLSWNFEEINQQMDIALKKYKGLVFTESDLGEAKKTRANLNNVVKQINAKKIEVKKEFMKPYSDFEEQVKEVMNKVNEVNSEIDLQIKAFEEKRKEEKRQRIYGYFEIAMQDSLEKEITLEKLFNDKWLNVTYKDEQWEAELEGSIQEINNNIQLIDSFTDKDIELIKSFYLKDLDLNKALQREKEIALRKHRAEQEKIASEPAIKPIEVKQEVEQAQTQQETQEEQLYVRTFTVQGTKQQIIDLDKFMKTNGIKFKRV